MSRASWSACSAISEPAIPARRLLHLRPHDSGLGAMDGIACERWTPAWEPGDGGFHLDLTGTERLHGRGPDGPARVCREASHVWGPLAGGFAPTRLAAALASRLAAAQSSEPGATRPSRSVLWAVPAGSVSAFLAFFPVTVLAARHVSAVALLIRRGVRTLGDLQAVPPGLLALLMGIEGARLAAAAAGEDEVALSPAGRPGRTRVAVHFGRPLSGQQPLAALLRATAVRAWLAWPGGAGSRQDWTLRVRRSGAWEQTGIAAPRDTTAALGPWHAVIVGLWNQLPRRRTGLDALVFEAGALRSDGGAAQGELFAACPEAARLAAAWRRAGRDSPRALHLAAEDLLAGWGAVWEA